MAEIIGYKYEPGNVDSNAEMHAIGLNIDIHSAHPGITYMDIKEFKKIRRRLIIRRILYFVPDLMRRKRLKEWQKNVGCWEEFK